MTTTYKLSDFDYDLPKELIAQYPLDERGTSRLLVVDRSRNKISTGEFKDLVNFFNEGDTIVLNNTKVLKARLFGRTESGVEVDTLLLKEISNNKFEVLIKPQKRLKQNDTIYFNEGSKKGIFERDDEYKSYLSFNSNLDEILTMPLPPYIKRKPEAIDFDKYQTVFAKVDGSVASPTAGLHFTEEILDNLTIKGINNCYVTLNVGYGTFKKIRSEDIRSHELDSEYFVLPQETVDTINSAKKNNKRVLSVGTTTTRVLESCFTDGELKANKGDTDLFIYPPFNFNVIDMLLTNFHMPRTSLMMLVSAFCDRKLLLEAYEVAKRERFRFLSYGDAMLII